MEYLQKKRAIQEYKLASYITQKFNCRQKALEDNMWYALRRLSELTTRLEYYKKELFVLQQHSFKTTRCIGNIDSLLTEIKEWRVHSYKPAYVNLDRFNLCKPKALFEELYSIRALYPSFTFDKKLETLTITTEEIVLEDRHFGCFDIVLFLKALEQSEISGCFETIALDPTDCVQEGLTHPHVQCNILCAGESEEPIRASLTEGRLVDFFDLVTTALRSYNPGGAYLQLENWDGIPCRSCGKYLCEDEASACDYCGEVVCEECVRNCDKCGHWVCEEHCTACDSCDSTNYCPECRTVCYGCDSIVCERCIYYCAECRHNVCVNCWSPTHMCSDCAQVILEDQNNQESEVVENDVI